MILILRAVAVAAMFLIAVLLWHVMARLPWQINCLIAIGAASAFSYPFERSEAR